MPRDVLVVDSETAADVLTAADRAATVLHREELLVVDLEDPVLAAKVCFTVGRHTRVAVGDVPRGSSRAIVCSVARLGDLGVA